MADDLTPQRLDAARDRDTVTVETLERMIGEAAQRATDSVHWYLQSKKHKRFWARTLRVSAIFGVAAAGVIPVLVTLLPEAYRFDAAWASIALAGSAFCVGLDRFFGFSTAWVRFITTELEISRLLDAFRYDWQLDRAAWKDGQPTHEQAIATIARCKAFVLEIDKLVQQETSLWVAEFTDALKQVDEQARAKLAAVEQAAINVTLTAAEPLDGGWTLAVNGGSPTTQQGASAALAVRPGLHVLSVAASVGGKRRTAERAVTVTTGAVAQVEFAL